MAVLFFFLGLGLLVLGAEWLVYGASRLGLSIGISPLVVGLTIVAFGTSSPELAVSLKAALSHHSDIVIGTCVGSSIFNILFILGLSALVAPLVVSQQLIWYEVPIMIGAHALLWIMSFNGTIDKLDSFLLFSGIILYTVFAIIKGRREAPKIEKEYEEALPKEQPTVSPFSLLKEVGCIVLGLYFCVLGADWLLDSAIVLAKFLGISELVIGMTIVAAGTSLPELATSVVATIRGQRDIAIGNVVGSNIFNILGIIGAAGLVAPDAITVAPSVLRFDLPVALAACIACLPVFFTGHKISRWEGAVFLGYYVIYTTYSVMAAKQHDALPLFSEVLLWFVLPLTLITFLVIFYRTMNRKRANYF